MSEDGILVPDVAPGGIASISIQNTGEQMHEVNLWRMREDRTRDEVLALDDYLVSSQSSGFG